MPVVERIQRQRIPLEDTGRLVDLQGARLRQIAAVEIRKVVTRSSTVMKRRMPFVDLAKFEKDPVVQNFGNLLTVSDLCRFIETKVAVA